MSEPVIPNELRRFLVTGALTVPHVEAIMQMRALPAQHWDAGQLAARLYLRPSRAAELLADLGQLGVVEVVEGKVSDYRYGPASAHLTALLDQLETAYSRHLVAVSRLIHSVEERKAHDFAAAFRFRKEP